MMLFINHLDAHSALSRQAYPAVGRSAVKAL